MRPNRRQIKPSGLIAQRLKQELKNGDLTASSLAKQAGVKTSFLYDILNGKSVNPSTLLLARVAEVLGVSINYLIGGKDERNNAASAISYVTIPTLTVSENGKTQRIPSDETPYHFERSWIEKTLKADPENLCILPAPGDGMSPTLSAGDILLIDTSRKKPSPPGIFVISDGFSPVPKRLEYTSQGKSARIRIASDNAKYSAYEGSLADTFIIGRVIWFARIV
jgi:phage repressor protein C with HTH and peptisase S24 domain